MKIQQKIVDLTHTTPHTHPSSPFFLICETHESNFTCSLMGEYKAKRGSLMHIFVLRTASAPQDLASCAATINFANLPASSVSRVPPPQVLCLYLHRCYKDVVVYVELHNLSFCVTGRSGEQKHCNSA